MLLKHFKYKRVQ